MLHNNPPQTSVSKLLKHEPGFSVFVEIFKKLMKEKDPYKLERLVGVEELARGLGVRLDYGIDTSSKGQERFSLEDREEAFGKNLVTSIKTRKSFLWTIALLKCQLLIPMIIVATVTTILGFSFEEERENLRWIDGVALWVGVFIIILTGVASDYQTLHAQGEMIHGTETFDVTVLRDGKEQLIKNSNMLVGDILLLTKDTTIGADGLLFVSNNLFVNEEAVTGDSEPIRKKLGEDPFCRSGTRVTNGSGKILVTAVGEESEMGQTLRTIADSTNYAEKWTNDVTSFFFWYNIAALCLGVMIFVVLFIRWMITKDESSVNDDGPVQILVFAIVIMVVELPLGYTMFDLFCFVFLTWKFAKDKTFVRNPTAFEAMSEVTSFCFDKTGTLTTNKMTVVKGWYHGTYFDELPNVAELDPRTLELITENASLNSDAFLNIEESGHVQFVGNRTECALLVMTEKFGVDYSEVRSCKGEQKVKDYVFNSDKKMSSSILRYGDVLRLYNKGAAEMVLNKCTEYVDPSGFVNSISKVKRRELENVIKTMAHEGLRTLALTYADLDPNDFNFGKNGEPLEESIGGKRGFEEAPEENLVLLAIVGIRDPVREGVSEVVKQFKGAGIIVRMITGDNIIAAKRVARECGILTSDGLAIEGPEFRRRAEEDVEGLKRDLPKLQVMARSSPSDKQNLVKLLESEDERVAVSGDGTNDVRALKESSIGFAMGVESTEVAKEASDVVILNDRVSSILVVYLWSQRFLLSFYGYMVFRLSLTLVIWIVVLVDVCIGGEIPLNIHQFLLVNFIMDTLIVLTFATENPPAEVPDDDRDREKGFEDETFPVQALIQSLYQITVIFCTFCSLSSLFERYSQDGHVAEMRKNSLMFNVFILMQLFNSLNCRKPFKESTIFEGLLESPLSLAIRVATVVLHIMIMFTPLRKLFKLTELNAWEWLFSMAVSTGVLVVGSFTRYVIKAREEC